MCAHSSSASKIIDKISLKLYPFISGQFKDLQEYNKANPQFSNARINEIIQNLRNEFDSLRNYETKLVFPSVLQVFDTKDDLDFKSPVNLSELQLLTHKKELHIKEFTIELEAELNRAGVEKKHPAFSIAFTFSHLFFDEKGKWNKMLSSWNKGCACFSKANQTANNLKHDSDFVG